MKSEHPELLLWHVAGSLGPEASREIERHLQECGDCREEAAGLASMMRSVRTLDRGEHVDSMDLALYEEDPRSLDPGRRAGAEAHLAECAECRGDLQTLRRAREREGASASARPARRPSLRARLGLGAAVAAALALVALVLIPFRTVRPEPSPSTDRVVVFSAPRRGAEPRPVLAGSPPWRLRILLPFGAREGSYRVEIHRAGAGDRPLFATSSSTDTDLGLPLTLESLPGPGTYEVLLRAGAAEEEYRYPFELPPGAVPPPER